MIRNFACRETERLFEDESSGQFPPDIERGARRKLMILHQARTPGDLSVPPGNRLEKLKGSRKGQYSIRINQKWRICFRWHEGDAYDVEIVDYHS